MNQKELLVVRFWKCILVKRRLKRDLSALLRLVEVRSHGIPKEFWSDPLTLGFLYGFGLLLQQIYGGIPKHTQHHFVKEILGKLSHRKARVSDVIHHEQDSLSFQNGAQIAERLFCIWMRVRHIGDVVDQTFYWEYLSRSPSLDVQDRLLPFVPLTTSPQLRLLGVAMLDYHIIAYVHRNYPPPLKNKPLFFSRRSLNDA